MHCPSATDDEGATFVQDVLLSVIPAISLSSTQIPEGLDPFSPVATLSTTNGDNPGTIYSLVSSDLPDDNHLFTILDDQLYFNAYSDHEQRSDYTVRVQSVDSSSSVMEECSIYMFLISMNPPITFLFRPIALMKIFQQDL